MRTIDAETAASKLWDVAIIGSGTTGSMLARELTEAGLQVLVLERGLVRTPSETLAYILSVANEVKLGDNGLSKVRALTAGGSTSMYFAVADPPEPDCFRPHGIELESDIRAVLAELPVSALSESQLSPQSRHLRDSARALGYDWQPHSMLVDSTKCQNGYAYDAKWLAIDALRQAVDRGASLLAGATALRVLEQSGQVSGVEFQYGNALRKRLARVRAGRVVVAAGEAATPQLLRASGLRGIGEQGFYCNPGYALYGLVDTLEARDTFVGSMGCEVHERLKLGDANINRKLHLPMMLGGLKLRHLFAYRHCLGIGVNVSDSLSGELRPDGSFWKTFNAEEQAVLEDGRLRAHAILEQAGAHHISNFGLTSAGRLGGLVRLSEHLDAGLESEVRGLHVCDGAVLPDTFRGTPTLTLVCLARYLSRRLVGGPQHQDAEPAAAHA